MVSDHGPLNRAGWNAVSSPEKRRGRIAAAPAGGSILRGLRAQRRSTRAVCGFSDCTLRKVWSPIVATR
jgi:hypothetical protein